MNYTKHDIRKFLTPGDSITVDSNEGIFNGIFGNEIHLGTPETQKFDYQKIKSIPELDKKKSEEPAQVKRLLEDGAKAVKSDDIHFLPLPSGPVLIEVEEDGYFYGNVERIEEIKSSLSGKASWQLTLHSEGQTRETYSALKPHFGLLTYARQVESKSIYIFEILKLYVLNDIDIPEAPSSTDDKALGQESVDHAAGPSCIVINEHTGQGVFRLPVRHFLEQGGGAPFELNITAGLDADDGRLTLNIFDHGRWAGTGGHNYPSTGVDLIDVPLYQGHTINAKLSSRTNDRTVGPNYVVDASPLLTKRRKAFPEGSSDFQSKPLADQFVSILHKNGMAQVFECAGEAFKAGQDNVLMTELLQPSGLGLTFTWESKEKHPRIVRIADAAGTLLTASWIRDDNRAELKDLVLFPDSDEQITYECVYSANSVNIIITGSDPIAEKMIYKIQIGDNKIQTVSCETRYSDNFTRESRESLTYHAEKISSYSVQSQNSSIELRKTYTYDEKGTTVVLSKGDATLSRTLFEIVDNQLRKQTVQIGESISTVQYDLQADESRNVAVLHTSHHIDGQPVDNTVAEFDVEGNLISLARGDNVTEWTYFNNYTHYSVAKDLAQLSSGAITIVETVLKNLFRGALTGTVLEHTSFTTSQIAQFTSFEAYSQNNYATTAFSLPVAIDYPGDEIGFNCHIESERIYRKQDGHAVEQQITYFGYDKLTPKPHHAVDRRHSIVLARKLKITEPDLVYCFRNNLIFLCSFKRLTRTLNFVQNLLSLCVPNVPGRPSIS
ncbi:hypothetical protein [Pseudomonas sp. LP_7_YM]|uniref:hypothetical protein n=1 Tax=Pseudomonas sp. LP_7_YM TaxID=2485137 RepID=UPI0010611C35|nr:hypothetical protein [Pseudomonas sp. LP_7_YM]TDV59433.1 hypothetical protein EC915_11741 [Pseudomonas sp. LP_7_YM]